MIDVCIFGNQHRCPGIIVIPCNNHCPHPPYKYRPWDFVVLFCPVLKASTIMMIKFPLGSLTGRRSSLTIIGYRHALRQSSNGLTQGSLLSPVFYYLPAELRVYYGRDRHHHVCMYVNTSICISRSHESDVTDQQEIPTIHGWPWIVCLFPLQNINFPLLLSMLINR